MYNFPGREEYEREEMERLKNGGGSENSRREGCMGSNRGFNGRRGNSGIFIGREIGASIKS